MTLKFEFFPISIDFLISLVRNNENLMKKIGEKLSVLTEGDIEKLNKVYEYEINSNSPRKNDLLSVAAELKNQKKKNEIIENIKSTILKEDNFKMKDSESLLDFRELEFKNLRNNLLLFFATIAKKNCKKEKMLKILKFYRTICSHANRGITPNQEILFKIMKPEAYGKCMIMKIMM